MTLGANLELKARDRDPARSLRVCEGLGAVDEGTLSQLDTYFDVPRGRLKLREQAGSGAQLIAYERADDRGDTESRYRLVAVPDPAELKAALAGTIGVRVEVRKRRAAAAFAPLLADLRGRLGIEDDDLLPVSYSDLVEGSQRRAR